MPNNCIFIRYYLHIRENLSTFAAKFREYYLMKGLEQYVEKHGRHFTEQLAHDASGGKFSPDKVENAAQRKVYYNVTGSTLGDMVYLVNTYWFQPYDDCKKLNRCVDFALMIVGDFCFHGGKVFDMWLESLPAYNGKFDFTPYI